MHQTGRARPARPRCIRFTSIVDARVPQPRRCNVQQQATLPGIRLSKRSCARNSWISSQPWRSFEL